MNHSDQNQIVKSSFKNLAIAIGLAAAGVAFGAAGIYVGDTDDAPGAALLGILLMIVALICAVKVARRKSHLDAQKG